MSQAFAAHMPAQMSVSLPASGTPPLPDPFGAGAPDPLTALKQDMARTVAREGRRLAGADRALVENVLTFAALAEQRIAEQQARIAQLESLAKTDELTGCLNRRGFAEVLRRSVEEARRHGEFGVVALIDLDGFKAINDRYGHAAGDAVLARVADFLRGQVRATDYVARLGGDEFALVYTRCDVLPARRRILKLKAAVGELTVPWGKARLSVGASVGLEAFGPGADADEVLKGADAAMYRDKARRPAERRASFG